MKKKNYLLLFLMVFVIFITKAYAVTIRETMDENDGYTTLEEGSIIIGATRFSPNTIVTASRAATAGVNDVMLYMAQNGNTNGYEMPGVYYYVDPYVGWFFLDSNNDATPVVNEKELEELSKLDIYYVDNVEKVLEVDFPSENVDESTLPDGVILKNNKLLINATVQKVEFKTKDDKKVSFIMDSTTSQFIEDIKTCYTVSNGVITTYNKDCGSEVVIPLEINDEEITGIESNAFKNTNLISVVIPNQIESIGNNAFADNKLESVIIKDKYNASDFSFYGDNVFGDFNKVLYDNELTRMLNYVESNYILKYYKDANIDNLKNNLQYEYGLRDYLSFDMMGKFKDNGYDKEYEYCWGECNYEEKYINGDEISSKDVYGVNVSYKEDYKYDFVIEKYDVSANKVYTVTKPINVTLEETGIKEDYNIVKEAIENLQMDTRFEDISNYREFATRIKYFEDIEDLYDIKVVLTPAGYGTGIESTREWGHHASGVMSYYLKDGVLYKYISDVMLIGYENNYIANIDNSNYENLDEYIETILAKFSKDTGVNNYYIYYSDDGKSYGKAQQLHKAGIDYQIELIDTDYEEKWVIEFIDYYEDKYDEDGFTKAECFGFDNGIITSYDGTCGANVKIPNQINGIDVIEIASDNYGVSNLFNQSGIKSVVLPNTLKKIGKHSFENNKLTELIIPESVTEIGYHAFAGNLIQNLVIPNNITKLGEDAFSWNNIETLKIGTGLEEIPNGAFGGNKIKNLEIPENIKKIKNWAFENNEIEELILNEGLEEIGNKSFAKNKIESLNIPKTVKTIGYAAFTDNQLPDDEAFIYARKYDEETNQYVNDYEVLVSYGGANRKNVVIPNSVKTIEENALYNTKIEKIELPYGLETIREWALAYNRLTSLSIPNTVKTIERHPFNTNKFEGENSFIYMHDKDGNIDYTTLVAFENYKPNKVEELVIPNTVKKIWSHAFSSVVVNNLVIPYGVEEIGDYAFEYITINNPVTLPKSIKKLGKGIFNNTISNNDKDGLVYARNEDGTIDKSILMAYKGYLEYNSDRILTLPEGIVEIRENVFNGNTNLKGIILPSTLEKIGDNAFENTEINEFSIPSNVKSIGNNAFGIGYGTLNIFISNKSSERDFEYLGANPFGNAKEIIYENRVEVNEVTLNKTEVTLVVGDSDTLIATINPSNATDKDIVWTSSNYDVVTVNNGIIEAAGEGSAVITATVGGKSVNCNVTVNKRITYTPVWEKIQSSIADEYYLYIVSSEGQKVSAKVKITYINEKAKEHEVAESGIKVVKTAVSSIEIISINN